MHSLAHFEIHLLATCVYCILSGTFMLEQLRGSAFNVSFAVLLLSRRFKSWTTFTCGEIPSVGSLDLCAYYALCAGNRESIVVLSLPALLLAFTLPHRTGGAAKSIKKKGFLNSKKGCIYLRASPSLETPSPSIPYL
jgi:hypothetical protein